MLVRAQSGLGKSILLGKTVAELIHARHVDPEESKWPKFEKIMFSQLKDSSNRFDLELAICEGLDLVNRCRNLDGEAFERRNEEPHIVIIDSLDEHPMRTQWWEISEKLFDKVACIMGMQRPRLEPSQTWRQNLNWWLCTRC